MIDVDYEALEISIYSVLDERDYGKYDMKNILRTADMVWDNTAIEVKASDFKLIVDSLTYEVLDYTGYDG